jgi:hypothetical protein
VDISTDGVVLVVVMLAVNSDVIVDVVSNVVFIFCVVVGAALN